MTPADWTALAERIEALDGPEDFVDRDIALRMGWRLELGTIVSSYAWVGPDGRREIRPPSYTASLDATLSLLQDGWEVRISLPYSDGKCADVVVWNFKGVYFGASKTPALALLAAICRAMAEVG